MRINDGGVNTAQCDLCSWEQEFSTRRELKFDGWRVREGRDVCPDCVEAGRMAGARERE